MCIFSPKQGTFSLSLWKEYTIIWMLFSFLHVQYILFLVERKCELLWKNIHKRIIICILHYCSVLRKDILISETWVISLLITEGSSPSSFTLTGKAWLAGSMACSMHTNFLVTRLTTWQNSHLQWHVSEVLEFTVDIQITDATMETCAILAWRLAQSCNVIFHRHA